MKTLTQINQFHQTRPGLIVFGLVELGLAYLFASLAINSGSLWEWLLVLIFRVGTLQNFGRLIRRFVRDKS